jgi:hypothetical protein
MTAAIIAAALVSSCTSTKQVEPETHEQEFKIFSSDDTYSKQEQPRCKALMDNYCRYLYSPEALGNLEVRRAGASTQVLQGDTANDFSQVFYRYAQAKIRNRSFLPKDFYQALVKYHYFEKMENFIARSPRSKMTQAQRTASDQLDYELGSIWGMAMNETVVSRMEKKFPSFHKISERLMPVELDLERRRVRRFLISEISQAIWRNDKNWEDVEEAFFRLQSSYLRMLDKLDIPDQVRDDWKKRISEVQLVLPGAFPSISSDECSTTTVNAYYYTYLNVLTVCAGDFNSEDIVQTLAHEMGHALDINRTQYLFKTNSGFGRSLAQLRGEVCAPQTFSCDQWNDYKRQFSTSLQTLNGFQPELPDFQRCLKRRETSKIMSVEDITRISRTIVSDRLSELASNDNFLRITKPEVPMMNGKSQKNPNYLNPCSYYLWSRGEEPVDDDLTTLIYFTAEYRCSDKPGTEKLKNAIDTAKSMSEDLMKVSLQVDGEFSSRDLLETEGFSSPPYERFADVIGSYAMAELLTKLPYKWDRQNKFLASSSWLCTQPSLASHFPDESAVEKEYIFDSHTEGDQRKKELFSSPIRDVIGCQKDFDFKECSLPFKK